jgi:glycerol uptake facilitator-like aquaporin
MNRFTAEFLGTFFLATFALIGNPLGLAVGLVALIWVLGPISGAHFNPVVTASFRIRGKITNGGLLGYIGTQFVAVSAAAFVTAMLVGHDPERAEVAGAGAPDAWLSALTAEILGTCFIVFVILVVATCRRTTGNTYAAPAIGAAVFGAISTFGATSGFFNPAITWASGLHDLLSSLRADTDVTKAFFAELIRFGKFLPWACCLIIAQFIGAVCANGFFWLIYPEDREG